MLLCWWCVHPLPHHPCIHLPVQYNSKLNRFSTIGNFCSWQCAKAYAIDIGTVRAGEIQSLLALMRKQSLGKYTPLWPAPKRQALECFGGTMSIETFRTYGGRVEPPMVHFPFEKRFTQIISSDEVSRPIFKEVTVDSDLRLKRSKPLPRSVSVLENALGIKRKV